jgi:hypothetical protein
MTKRIRAALVAACLAGGWWASPAGAQTLKPKPKNLEVDAGFLWTGGASLGSAPVNETKPDGSPFAQASTTSQIKAGPGAEVRLAYRLHGSIWVEAIGAWSRTTFATTVTGDTEGAANVVATEAASQFTVAGAVVFCLPRHGKIEPFVRGGGGWMRQVSSGFFVGENGTIGDVGGGVKYWVRDRPKSVPIGIRIEGRVVIQSGGFILGTRARRLSPAFAAAAIFRF